jgi:hypothetical protein
MQIGGEGMENLFVNMVLDRKALKVHKSKKTPFHASLLRNGLNIFQIGTIQIITLGLWNLKLSYLNQFQ